MSRPLEIAFVPLSARLDGTIGLLVAENLTFAPLGRTLDQRANGALTRAAEAARFTGKAKSAIEVLAPAGLDAQRLYLIGVGAPAGASDHDWLQVGGHAAGQLAQRRGTTATLVAELPGAGRDGAAETAADIALGALLRCYAFRKYLTRPAENGGEQEPRTALARLDLAVPDVAAARAAFTRRAALADGVVLARDLVNEPANMLGPVEFAARAEALTAVGVTVEILDVPALEDLKMGALLAVAQGSARPARVAVMQWHGAKSKRSKPLCFIGKGVCFDTGGISIKPAAGMEDMKGDMAGAACVTGLMHALAARQAPVNAVGLIGLVENMPSGRAQRPGDIVTSMSGQTVEVLNTDAEGRLVLADLLWYAQERFKPKLMINLATLTGAIMVALGKEHAGLFSNDDRLAQDLIEAGTATGEKVWRMPLAREYDKLIDSKSADVKNIGGRFGGAITAAQFLQRFVKATPWAHLDIAGVAMDSVKSEISQSWASGWGVRLLDRFVAERHERSEK